MALILSRTEVDLGIQPLLFNDVTNKSIDARMVLAQSFFQVALVMIGALWGLVIAKPGESQIVFREKAEMTMFISASVVLNLVTTGLFLLPTMSLTHHRPCFQSEV